MVKELIDVLVGFSQFGFSMINHMHDFCVAMFFVDYFISLACFISFHVVLDQGKPGISSDTKDRICAKIKESMCGRYKSREQGFPELHHNGVCYRTVCS